MSSKHHCSPGTLICTPVPVKPTFLTQNSLCPPHCCAAAHFSHLPANRHQVQWARSRFFDRKTMCSCLKERFNTENCKNEISLKNRNQVQKKSKHYSHRREVMHKSEYPEEAILHCKVARSQTPSLAFFLSPSFVDIQLSSLLQEQLLKFSLCWHTIRFQNLQKFFKFSITPVGITLLLHLSGHYLPRHIFSIKEIGFEDI